MQGKAIKAQFNNFYNNAEKKIIQQLAVTNEVFREKLKKADAKKAARLGIGTE